MNGSKWNETETKAEENNKHMNILLPLMMLRPSTLLPLLPLLSPFLLAARWCSLLLQQQQQQKRQRQRNKQNSRKILIRFCMSCLFLFVCVCCSVAVVASVHLKHSWYESCILCECECDCINRHSISFQKIFCEWKMSEGPHAPPFRAMLFFFLSLENGDWWMFHLLHTLQSYCLHIALPFHSCTHTHIRTPRPAGNWFWLPGPTASSGYKFKRFERRI